MVPEASTATATREVGSREWALAMVGVVAAAAFLVGIAVGSAPLRLVAKPIPVLCLAVWVGAAGRGAAARPVCFGLVLSALGDWLLEANPGLFLSGLMAFLGAHVAYTTGFVLETRRASVLWGVPFA